MVQMIVAILGNEVGFVAILWSAEVDSRALGMVVQQTYDMLSLEWKGYGADPGNLCKVGQA